MFTGIVETTALLIAIEEEGSNRHFTLQTPLASELKIDQSVAHDGVCLTVVAIEKDTYTVTAIAETLYKTVLSNWEAGRRINLERCLPVNGRLDGHFVQGHVDATIQCTDIVDQGGSYELSFSLDDRFAPYLIEKGSVCINGVSLTCFAVAENTFSVAIIPYTWQHTNMQQLKVGDHLNVEFDVLGKYMLRHLQLIKKT